VAGKRRNRRPEGSAAKPKGSPVPAAEPAAPRGGAGRLRRWWWVLVALPLAAGLVVLRGAAADDGGLAGEADIWQLTPEELEARIDQQLAVGEAATLDWRVLEQLNHLTGQRSTLLDRLDGRVVRIPGFAVPLEDYAEEFAEFLVVPWAGACIHTPPPPPNQMVYARMTGGRKAKTPWWDPVWVEGTLHVIPTMSPYGAVGYQLEGLSVVPLEW
jgi:uncharacterized protein